MVEGKNIDKPRGKILKNRIIEPIQIKFIFKEKDGEKGFKEILNDLQNIGLTPIGTKRAKMDNSYILCYYVRVRSLPFTQNKSYNNIKKNFNKILNEFIIQRYEDIDLEWSNDDLKEISQKTITELLKLLLKNIDSVFLETILSNNILNSPEPILKDEDLETLGLEDNLEIFKKLFSNEKKISNKEIKYIFELIDTNDFILIKQIFHLILKKSDYAALDLYNDYHKIIGKIPFPREKLKFIYTSEIADEISVLELFFKNYILLENLIQEVNEKSQGDPEDIKIEIPFDIKAYKLEKVYPKRIINILKGLFSKKREFIIPIFKMVLDNELRRLNIKFKGLLVSFSYNDSPENIKKLCDKEFYFDSLKKLYDCKLEAFRRATKSGVIDEFVVVHGYHITQRNKVDFDWSKEFKIRDKDHQRILCKVSQNRTYFNELPLDMESEIEIQAIFRAKYKYTKKYKRREIKEKFLDVIDIKIIDNFKVIKFHLGIHFNGDKWLENTREGLSLFIYPMKEKREAPSICQTKILDCPLILLNVYEGQNETFYEAKINGEIIIKPKKQLIEELEERNLVIDDGLIKKAVSNILRESIREYDLNSKPMFNTIGIFLKDDDFILVYEDDEHKRIIGENDVQTDLIEKIKEKELDKDGILTEIFYKIIHLETLPKNVRLSILGFSAIFPFFYALRKKLDLLPALFLIGKHGSGKTTTLKIFSNLLFGTTMKKADDIRTEARLTKFLTESLFAINIDDVDYLSEENVGLIKTYSTERGTRNRMDYQRMNKEQMYASITGSANSKEFLTHHDDQAFRLRCIVHELKTNIKAKTENKNILRQFRKLYQQLKGSNKIYGFYLLEKALEFFKMMENNDDSIYKKMLQHFDNTYEKLEDYIDENTEFNLSDIRRLTSYTLICLGWEIWDYTFRSKGFNSQLLKEALDWKTGTFYNYINDLETAELNLRLGIIDNILQFFTKYSERYSNKKSISKDSEKDGLFVLQTNFINDYDQWAKNHGYKIVGSLARLGEIQSEILNKDTSPTTITFLREGRNYREYGLIFCYEELLALRSNGPKESEIEISVEETTGKIDMDRIFVEQSKIVLTKLDLLMPRLEQIFEENEGKALEKNNIIQVLELDEDLDKKDIENILEELIKDGTLYEPKEGFIIINKEL